MLELAIFRKLGKMPKLILLGYFVLAQVSMTL